MYPNQPSYPNQGFYPQPPTGAPQPPPVGFAPAPAGYPPVAPGAHLPYPPSPYPPSTGGLYPSTGGLGYPNSSPYPASPSPSPYPSSTSPSPYPSSQGYPGQTSPYPSVGPTPGGYPSTGNLPAVGGYPSSSPYPPNPVQGGHSPSHGYHHHQTSSTHHQTHQHQSPRMQAQPDQPTIREAHFDASQDAQALRKAMKGFGTDEKTLINVLCRRTNNQRLQIAQTFKSMFGKDLIKDMKSETSGNFEELLVALVTPRYEYIADRVKSAVSGFGTKERFLIDILCTSSNQELQWIQHAFMAKYHQRLEDKVASDTSGYFKRLLISMCAAGRNEMAHTDPNLAVQDAQALYSAGLKQWGTDESVFNMIMSNRSYPHLRQVLFEYEKLTGKDIESTVKSEFSGDIEDALLAIVKCVKNRPAYFAERIQRAMRGMGTNDSALIFYLVTRCEIDLESIKVEYHKLYSRSLAQDISSESSGD